MAAPSVLSWTECSRTCLLLQAWNLSVATGMILQTLCSWHQFRCGTSSMAFHICYSRHGRSYIALRAWHFRYCTSGMAHQILHFGHGTSDIALRTWHFRYCTSGMAHQILHFGHGTSDIALRACDVKIGTSDMSLQIWCYGHHKNGARCRRNGASVMVL